MTQPLPKSKHMKKLLLIVSILFLTGCDNSITDRVRIDDYEFYSLKEFNQETKQIDVDVITNMKNSKKIKGPVKGYDVKNLYLVNNKKEGDTLIVVIYEKGEYFRIGEDYYQAKKPILSE